MSKCNHGSEIPDSVVAGLHGSQAGWARHKCVACAYQTGLELGLEFGTREAFDGLYSNQPLETCQDGQSAPCFFLDQIVSYQGSPGRHRCAICAFNAGFEKALLEIAAGNVSLGSHRTYPLPMTTRSSREAQREFVVTAFLRESPGQGAGTSRSAYHYTVEESLGGVDIVLRRPAPLYKGFDFVVYVDDYDFNLSQGNKRRIPRHADIEADLLAKKSENSSDYGVLFQMVRQVCTCQLVDIRTAQPPTFSSGMDSSTLLGVLKWMFVEQDIRGWNYSGRMMLMSGLPTP